MTLSKQCGLRRLFTAMMMLIAMVVAIGGQRIQAQGTERLLFIRAQFADAPMPMSDAVWLQELMNVTDAAEAFFVANSYGYMSGYEADYTPVFTLPGVAADYIGDLGLITYAMLDAASDAGYSVGDYDHQVLSYPGVLNQNFGAAAIPGRVWLPGEYPWAPGFVHEMGHSYNVGHAGAVEGNGTPYPGVYREGRDGLFVMGSDDGDMYQMPLPMKYVIGWVDEQHIVDVDSHNLGTHRIWAYDRDTLPEPNTLGVRFQADGQTFWISFAPGLADLYPEHGGEVWEQGVIIHVQDTHRTFLLDFTPGSQGAGDTADWIDTRDGALVLGTSFTFPEEITIIPIAVGETDGWKWIDVRIIPEPTTTALLLASGVWWLAGRRRA